LTYRQLNFEQVFLVLAIPGVIAAAALFIKLRAYPESCDKPAASVSLGH
jgi:hypothetical protein